MFHGRSAKFIDNSCYSHNYIEILFIAMEKDQQLTALEPGELELFVQCMEPSKIETVGNSSWVDWHIRLQKLNQQAVLEATAMLEEQTKEALISDGKLSVLVHEAICIQVWRTKIFPQIMKLNPEPTTSFGIYMVLYHEACAVGLLETAVFHEDSAECLGDVQLDLLTYAVEMITSLVSLIAEGYLKTKDKKRGDGINDELDHQRKDLQFDIGMRCISIVRYIAEHMDASGGSATIATSLYRTHDVPSLLAHLLRAEPWRRNDACGNLQTFNFGRWAKPNDDEIDQMHRTEAQLWLCLRQLLLDPRLQQYYNMDNVRKTQFCQLQAMLSERLLDQIPPLGELKLFLCRLAVADTSATLPPSGSRVAQDPGCLLIEVVPQIKEFYLGKIHKRIKNIAKSQLSFFKMDGSPESMETARRILASYTSDAALALDGGGARCAACGEPAAKKCSRCKSEWYCGRECQVRTWPRHKELCDQFAQVVL